MCACALNNLSKKNLLTRDPAFIMVFAASRLMGAHANDRVSMRWWIGEDYAMVARDDGKKEVVMGVSVQNWHTSTERTTLHGFKALFSSRLGVRITTRRAASHCALGSRFARCHSTFCGTPAWLGLFPIA